MFAFWGAHAAGVFIAAARSDVFALGEGAIASTRAACAPRNINVVRA
jgi:hypothetical protein